MYFCCCFYFPNNLLKNTNIINDDSRNFHFGCFTLSEILSSGVCSTFLCLFIYLLLLILLVIVLSYKYCEDLQSKWMMRYNVCCWFFLVGFLFLRQFQREYSFISWFCYDLTLNIFLFVAFLIWLYFII